jgi:hypothetical protein
MQDLNFPAFEFRIKNNENKPLIFDVVRKKFVALQPEEWVRQHVVHYLNHIKKYPLGHINVEKKIQVHGLTKRYDVVVFKADGSIAILVECKAPGQPVRQEVFDQIARYNLRLNAEYLMLTNGMQHYYCKMDFSAGHYTFLKTLPAYAIDNT